MKNKIYKICSVLIILLSALNARSEVIVGISLEFLTRFSLGIQL
jgi:hypothetical protein